LETYRLFEVLNIDDDDCHVGDLFLVVYSYMKLVMILVVIACIENVGVGDSLYKHMHC
jgi:hypothetical protein